MERKGERNERGSKNMLRTLGFRSIYLGIINKWDLNYSVKYEK